MGKRKGQKNVSYPLELKPFSKSEQMRRLGMHWLIAGLTVALAVIIWVAWNVRNRAAVQAGDPETVRVLARKVLDARLDEANHWLTNLSRGAEVDSWLIGIRNQMRPFFNVLSKEFDSQLIFIIREFDLHPDDSGPFREHSRQLALVSVRSLLGEERRRLEDSSMRREDVDSRLVRLPISMLLN